jgi:nitroreductase
MTQNISFENRPKENQVDELFLKRWSPRSFKEGKEISNQDIKTIFEAARWAPSCYNDQPWRFLISENNEESFQDFFKLLVEGNQVWAKNSSRIGFVIAKNNFEMNGKPNSFNEFDAGSSWMSLVLQAEKLGISAHGMGGILKDEVYKKFNISKDDYTVICGFVLGYQDDPEKLPDDLKEREKPSSRKSLDEILSVGKFGF